MSTLDNLQSRYQKSLLNKKETAKEIGISTNTLDRLRKNGEIKSKKVGGGIYFSLNELALFLDS